MLESAWWLIMAAWPKFIAATLYVAWLWAAAQ